MFSPHVTAYKNQHYEELRRQSQERAQLFEDPEFPCVDSSLFFSKPPPGRVEWQKSRGHTHTHTHTRKRGAGLHSNPFLYMLVHMAISSHTTKVLHTLMHTHTHTHAHTHRHAHDPGK